MKKFLIFILMLCCCFCFAENNKLEVPYIQFQQTDNMSLKVSYILLEGHLYIFVREYKYGGCLVHSERCVKCKNKKKEEQKKK